MGLQKNRCKMAFDWLDYLELAKEMAARKDEACLRTAVSRAYYGVFCLARDRSSFWNYTDGDVHKKVIMEYKNSKDSKEKHVGTLLGELREKRNNADYQAEKNISGDFAKRVIIQAETVSTKLKEIADQNKKPL